MKQLLEDTFSSIYENNTWADKETVSGGGSRVDRTIELRETLPQLLRELEAHTMLDAGCGDWNWMRTLDLGDVKVAACDIVRQMIAADQKLYGSPGRLFFVADITEDPFPYYDLILCRTVLFHLSFSNVKRTLENFRRSGSRYLLATTHPHVSENVDIQDGQWRRLNLQIAPFNLPEPILSFPDGPGDDGYLALWAL